MMTTDAEIRDILTSVKTIALVGFSANPGRPSHGVAQFLKRKGFRVIPVNPGLAGQTFLGETVYASLKDIPDPIDMVDVFRASEFVAEVMEEAIAIKAKVVWTQLDVVDEPAAAKGRAAGLKVVMDRCPAIEMPRLGL
jgi:predicted CoA-binding protein